MATPRTPNQKKQYAKLNVRLAKYGKLVEQLYEKFNREAAKIAMRTDYDPDAGKMFRFQDYPITREAIMDLLNEYVSDMTGIINRTTAAEWENSNEFQDLVANKVLKAYGVQRKDGTEYERYYQANSDHLKAFQTRTVNGMNLSRRVWNLKEQYKQELEMGLSVGIERGTSAASLAKQMKQYLNEPDKLFRRVRDKFGNLQLSKNAKAYHPGRGVYRSSFKNAMRLTRSETNMAYRTAEQTRWRQFDFVVGYEIKLSQSHPCHDVCDELAGKYPKDFVWTGWHPMDLCYCVSILKTQDEFWRDLGNEDNAAKSTNEVTDVPEAFKNWVKDNADRIEAAEKRGTQPYFIRDNKEYIQGILKPAEAKKTPLEIAAERHAARTQEDIDRIQSEWNTNRLNHLMELSERIGSYRDAEFRDWAYLLDADNSENNFRAFKNDYKFARQYLDNKIAEQTAMARKFMEDPANVANMKELAKALGAEQGDYMTFFEANVLRGNPNYAVSEAYRINCQTCVVAHELRRRGFNVEALANTAGSWLEKLSRMTNDIWLDASGNMPKKTIIGAEYNYVYGITPSGRRIKRGWQKTVANRKQLISELEKTITEDGRYHIDWCWNTQSKRYVNGHIITIERNDGLIRYYDPQNGKVIENFYDYIADIQLKRGIRLLRVDNLRVKADYAAHILGKSGSKAIGDEIGKGGISGKLRTITVEECNFTLANGGSITTPEQRLNKGNLNKQEQSKFEKELRMANNLAKNGKKIVFNEEFPGIATPDIKIDGIPAELKSLKSHNNIHGEAKSAINDQGAKIVVFEFNEMTPKIHQELNRLSREGIHGYYYSKEDYKLHEY
ncbi:MAG: toxin glutamine deamidase domain-containing protein [Muribaculum sp.]|nr:toxin glutamine deamidase domain-containing protein [Muribaculum sp.]